MRLENLWDETLGKQIGYLPVELPGPRGAAGVEETVLAVPGYYQAQTYTCGFTAGLMVLHTFHPRRSPARFLRAVAPDPAEGGTPRDRLVRALRDNRIGVGHLRRHTFEAIARRIEDGQPIITMVNNGRGNHWVVLYGVERGAAPTVYVAANGLAYLSRVRYPWASFERIWEPRATLACWGL